MSNEKQIVFIEPKPTLNAYRIARSLKLTGNYKTILFCFSEVDKEVYSGAYDKILTLELNHKIKFGNLIDFFKKVYSKEGRKFFKKLKEIKPYLFQITGPDLFSLMAISLLKKSIPKVYYANDIWGVEKRDFLFKKYGFKGDFQRICERICFKLVDGIINKHSLGQFGLLDYEISIPKISLSADPLDDWTFAPKKKRDNEMHLVYGGSPFPSWVTEIPFLEIVKIITAQKIHFHSYGNCVDEKENKILIEESKKNKYYHFHNRVRLVYDFNREMSKCNYSILPEFWTESELSVNPGVTKTEMCTKMTNYIEAGIPIIASNQNEYRLEIIRKYGIGFGINAEDLKNIKRITENTDYKKLQRNMKKYQETFKLSKRIIEVESFYKKIVKNKTD